MSRTLYVFDRDKSDLVPQPDGDVGGDAQAGDSMSIRAVYVRQQTELDESVAPYLVVTTYAYPVIYDLEGGEVDVMFLEDVPEENRKYGVDLMESLTQCTDWEDPGGTETSGDVEYPTPDLWALVYFSHSLEDAQSRLEETLVAYSKRSDCTPEEMPA